MSSESKPKLGAGFSQGDILHVAMIYLVLVTLPVIAVVLLSSLTGTHRRGVGGPPQNCAEVESLLSAVRPCRESYPERRIELSEWPCASLAHSVFDTEIFT